jgi:prevent-host-death family protein
VYVSYVKYMNDSSGIERISFSDFRKEMAETLDRVKYRGERVVVHRRGRDAAALVPLEDLERLEALGEAERPQPPRKRRQRAPKGDRGSLGLESIRRELGL